MIFAIGGGAIILAYIWYYLPILTTIAVIVVATAIACKK